MLAEAISQIKLPSHEDETDQLTEKTYRLSSKTDIVTEKKETAADGQSTQVILQSCVQGWKCDSLQGKPLKIIRPALLEDAEKARELALNRVTRLKLQMSTRRHKLDSKQGRWLDVHLAFKTFLSSNNFDKIVTALKGLQRVVKHEKMDATEPASTSGYLAFSQLYNLLVPHARHAVKTKLDRIWSSFHRGDCTAKQPCKTCVQRQRVASAKSAPVYIVGAGPAGLVAAFRLVQLGVRVEVIEKRPVEKATSRDQILVLRENALKAFRASAIFPQTALGRSAKGQTTCRTCDIQLGYLRTLALCGVPVHFGSTFVNDKDGNMSFTCAGVTTKLPKGTRVILANGVWHPDGPRGLMPPRAATQIKSQQVIRVAFRAVPQRPSKSAYVPSFELAMGAQAPRGGKLLPKINSAAQPGEHKVETALHLSIGEMCYLLLIVKKNRNEPTPAEVARLTETLVRHGPERHAQCRNLRAIEIISAVKFPYSIPRCLPSMSNKMRTLVAVGDRLFPGYWPHGTGIEKATVSGSIAAVAIAEHIKHPTAGDAVWHAADDLFGVVKTEIEKDRLSRIRESNRRWTGSAASGFGVETVQMALQKQPPLIGSE